MGEQPLAAAGEHQDMLVRMGMLTILVGCNGPAILVLSPMDLDRDGFALGVDCDDADAEVHPGAAEVPGDGVDQDCDQADALAEATWTGALPDAYFGSRVVLVGQEVWVGAPFWRESGGRPAGGLYQGDTPALEGAEGDLLGAGLAATADGRVIVGAPGAGEVRAADGSVLLALPGVGGVLAARGDTWVASTSTGAAFADGTRVEWDQRPDALALDAAGAVWGGFAHGPIALRVGSRTITRGSPADQAGYALLLADVDGDGAEDLVVGAPGIAAIYILDPTDLPVSVADVPPIRLGSGRFGAALAFAGELIVGAPMDGSDAEGADAAGALYAIREGVPIAISVGATPGAQLGAALTAGAAGLVAGAPGDAAAPGSVHVVRW